MSKRKQAQKDEERKKSLCTYLCCLGMIALIFGAMFATGIMTITPIGGTGDDDDDYYYDPDDNHGDDTDEGTGTYGGGAAAREEEPDEDVPDVETDTDYTWYQMSFQFVMTDEPEEPFEPLNFIPAVDGSDDFPEYFESAIFPVYWYGPPAEELNVPLDGTQVFSVYDYPIVTTDPLNQNYALWTAGYAESYSHSFWFETDLPEWEGEPRVTIFDGGFLIGVNYHIPVYYYGDYSPDAVLEVGYIQVSWVLNGAGMHFEHPWMLGD